MMSGNMLELLFHAPYGKHEFEWQKRYGRVYSIKGCIGVSESAEMRNHNCDAISLFTGRPVDGV